MKEEDNILQVLMVNNQRKDKTINQLQAELDKAKKILMAIEDRATVNFDNALLAYIRTLKERNENE